MKILILTWEFPPRVIGGISTHVYHLAKALASIGVLVHVLTCGFPDALPNEEDDGIRITRVDSGRITHTDQVLWTYAMNSLMIDEGAKILERESYDVIHAHDWVVARAGLDLKARYQIPLVATIHATEAGRAGDRYTPQKTIHTIERLLVQGSDRIICCSNFMKKQLELTFRLDSSKVDLIPNGIDPSGLQTFRTRDPRGNGGDAPAQWNGRTVLYVGRMVREKGLYTLIEAFEQVLRMNARARLILVGEGPIREALADEVQRRNLRDSIHFAGYVDQATLVDLYRSCDVFVLPSHYEPFGIAVLEAMANGRPVIVSDAGGPSEIVEHGVTGLKVEPGDAQSLAEAISSLLENQALAQRLAENAKRLIAEKYAWNSVADSTIVTYGRARSEEAQRLVLRDEQFLNEQSALQLLFSLGAARRETAKSSSDLAARMGAPQVSVKHILGLLVSQGYVSTLEPEDSEDIRYHVSGRGIVKTWAGFS